MDADDIPAPLSPREVPDWLLARNRHWATTEDLADLLGVPDDYVNEAIFPVVRERRLFNPVRGGYVPVPPEFRDRGVVPPTHFIDPMMEHLGRAYYVTMLSAAVLHGALSQRPKTFQVATVMPLKGRELERARLQFVRLKAAGRRPTLDWDTPTGDGMRVATPEVTVLDLAQQPERGDGLNTVSTIVTTMLDGHMLRRRALTKLGRDYPVAAARRAGWLVEQASDVLDVDFELDAMAAAARRKRDEPTPLDPNGSAQGPIDERWNLVLNAQPHPE